MLISLPTARKSVHPKGSRLVLRCRSLALAGWLGFSLAAAAGPLTGRVVAWGDNSRQQTNIPAGLDDVIAISAGEYHNLALKSDGTVVAWGQSSAGDGSVPAGLSNVVAISAGYSHNLVLKRDGSVVAWGRNDYGQGSVPAGFGNSNVVAIAAGDDFNLVLRSNGTVYAWGWNDYGQCNILNNSNTMGVGAGGLLSMVVRSNGMTAGYGWLAYGSATSARAVRPGYEHSMALLSNGTVQAWGNATWLQTSVPSGLNSVADLSGHYYHCLALKTNGTIVGWGRNDYGQAQGAPVWLTNAIAVSAGELHSLALVLNPPLIQVSNTATGLALTWPILPFPYGLQSATNLAGPFAAEPAVLTTNLANQTISTTLPFSGARKFFRLKKQ
jgi:alpha-tubulin suppressor-like RCC1 family protein